MGLKQRGYQLGYTGALILLLGAVIFFFASNWPALGRQVKIGCSLGLMLAFYLFPAVFRTWLPAWTIAGGTVAFGVSAALIGQIYNSHADSYVLFAVWFLPALLFWLLTKYRTYAVMAFILLELTAGSYADEVWDASSLAFQLSFAGLNALLFAAAWTGLGGRSLAAWLPYPTLVLFHAAMLAASVIDWQSPGLSWTVNLGYAALIGASVAAFGRNGKHRALWMLSAFASGVFVLFKFVELAAHYWNKSFLLAGLIAAAGLVAGAAHFVRKLRHSAKSRDERWARYASRVLVAVVSAVASLIGTSCLIGLLVLLFEDIDERFFYGAGLLWIAGSLAVSSRYDVVRHAIWLTGTLMAGGVAFIKALNHEPAYALALIAALALYLWKTSSVGAKLMTWIWLNALAWPLLKLWADNNSAVWLAIGLVNLGAAYAGFLHEWLRRLAWIGGWVSLYAILLEERAVNGAYVFYNGLFIAVVTAAVLLAQKRSDTFRYRTALAAWAMFFVHLYYDLAWKLLHKSAALAGLGLIVLFVTFALQKRSGYAFPRPERRVGRRWWAALIVLQLALLGVQAAKSETLLAKGTEIKLRLSSEAPRSLLQGDYLLLSYEIGELFEFERSPFGEAAGEDREWRPGRRISVALAPDRGEGIYRYAGAYRLNGRLRETETGAAARTDLVWITGRTQGLPGRVEYGIEHFYVPEGEGKALKERVRYAIVKVGKGGDAILADVAER
ncbi:GDYXXLXY domain-containing protein [Paenibacillus thermoaerophilus]|uniref:GDYXXLXY domain-containing protein n=1 Tax=Paenibacillus thermoaerophilus TaxID=1215385 RepID=A0ABW2V055_9BACL|nr:GDYXXLXY domain-containing protein [Paenibacillus thermoaerophilus]